jgi:drug/metabolite transporter (DMT)-like permease
VNFLSNPNPSYFYTILSIEDVSPASSWKAVVLAWTSMILALIASSSIGPVFKFMAHHGIPPFLSASWRCQCMTVFLIPLAIAEVYMDPIKNKVDWFGYKPDLRFPVIVHVGISGIAWAGNLLAWILALQYTTTFKASVLTSSHPIMLTIYMRCQNMPVSGMEYLGVLVSFLGLLLSSLQEIMGTSNGETSETVQGSGLNPSSIDHESAPHPDQTHEVIGIFLCLFAAAGEVLVMVNRMVTKKYVPLMQVSH